MIQLRLGDNMDRYAFRLSAIIRYDVESLSLSSSLWVFEALCEESLSISPIYPGDANKFFCTSPSLNSRKSWSVAKNYDIFKLFNDIYSN